MQNQDERANRTGQHGDVTENVIGNLKTLLLFIGGVALVLAILVLLPMFLTYLSEGDYRAPSEIHPTDSARKSSPSNYNLEKSNQ
jgi:Na+-transporting methylmalonyl-CoA/oxaloacetate decarboxylase gamma subunit